MELGNSILTRQSDLLRDNSRGMFRWGTSFSPAYLNNIGKCGNLISRWGTLWGRMKIIGGIKNNEDIVEGEKEHMGLLKISKN